MASESWVGFARSPKPNKDLVRASFEKSITANMSLVEVFNSATSADGLSSWLNKTSKAEVRTSGKIDFAGDGDFGRAIYSSVELGKLAVINSENFGEIRFDFKSSKNDTTVTISFSKMLLPIERDSFLEFAAAACDKLARILGAENE